jgi:hypothetical protein
MPLEYGARDLRERAQEVDDLPPGEVRGEPVVLGQVADALEDPLRACRLAEHRSLERGGPHHGHDDLDERALARAVRAEQAEHLAAPHRDRHAAQRLHAASVGLRHVAQVDGGHVIKVPRPKLNPWKTRPAKRPARFVWHGVSS